MRIKSRSPVNCWTLLREIDRQQHKIIMSEKPQIHRLTEQKKDSIIDKGFSVTGYCLRDQYGNACVIENSSVRWLSNEEFWNIMHPKNEGE
jgi:hypothetical protein